MKKLFVLALALVLFCFSEPPLRAQDKPTEQLTAEEQEKKGREGKERLPPAGSGTRRSPVATAHRESSSRADNAADLLWDQTRAVPARFFRPLRRALRSQADSRQWRTPDRLAEGIRNNVRPQNIRSFQLRQELVLAAARHDATLAYQLLAATKPPAPAQTATEQRGPRAQFASEENLEQTLLARIAALDPKLAAQNAEQMIDKGQFPRTLPEVINQLAARTQKPLKNSPIRP